MIPFSSPLRSLQRIVLLAVGLALVISACAAPQPTPTPILPTATVITASPISSPSTPTAPTPVPTRRITPKHSPTPLTLELERLPQVEAILAAIQPQTVADLLAGLTGEAQVTVGGERVTLRNRNTLSEEDIELAPRYVFELFSDMGYAPIYQDWQSDFLDIWGRNVIAELRGAVKPDELVLITAHLDNMPEEETAPGADDNASGCAAVLLAAKTLADFRFERTLRFVLFTGEEQGLLGSEAYAIDLLKEGAHVVAVINLDMIGYDSDDNGAMDIYTREPTTPGHELDQSIASTFVQVIAAYELGLKAEIISYSLGASDNWSFWTYGIPAILAIEDFEDFNDDYHEVEDNIANLNLPYLTRFIQAAAGTLAHLAVPVE